MRATPLWILALLYAAFAGAEDLKDPTLPPAPAPISRHAVAPTPPPRISAIFFSGARRVAIFNDQPVQAGDSVGAYHIDEVTAQGVRYRASGHDAFVPLTRLP